VVGGGGRGGGGGGGGGVRGGRGGRWGGGGGGGGERVSIKIGYFTGIAYGVGREGLGLGLTIDGQERDGTDGGEGRNRDRPNRRGGEETATSYLITRKQ